MIPEEEFLQTDAEAFVADIARETAERMKERGEMIDREEAAMAQMEFEEAPIPQVVETADVEARAANISEQLISAEIEDVLPQQRPSSVFNAFDNCKMLFSHDNCGFKFTPRNCCIL